MTVAPATPSAGTVVRAPAAVRESRPVLQSPARVEYDQANLETR